MEEKRKPRRSLNTVSRRHILLHVIPDEKRNTIFVYFALPFRNLESRDHVELFVIEEEKW